MLSRAGGAEELERAWSALSAQCIQSGYRGPTGHRRATDRREEVTVVQRRKATAEAEQAAPASS